ncbi:hypothetical protein E2I00_011470, partial [Balaenoptera physalus]
EPGPAKVAVTSSSSSIPSAEKVPTTKSTLWQEEMRAKDQPDGSSPSPAQSPSQSQPPVAGTLREPGLESRDEEGTTGSERADCGRKVRVESGYFSLEKTKQDPTGPLPTWTPAALGGGVQRDRGAPLPLKPAGTMAGSQHAIRLRSQVIEKFEALDIEKAEHMETNASAGPSLSSDTRQGRSEKRAFPRKRPDLLNFKKGWLTRQYEDGQWKKHWFVLADQSLRFYRDSVAEEAADLDGEIDLSTCYDVTEYPVQRNYGFQIHTKEGAFTLSAMTSGIRRNWIQTIMKHVHPISAPDVTRPGQREKLPRARALSHGWESTQKSSLQKLGRGFVSLNRGSTAKEVELHLPFRSSQGCDSHTKVPIAGQHSLLHTQLSLLTTAQQLGARRPNEHIHPGVAAGKALGGAPELQPSWNQAQHQAPVLRCRSSTAILLKNLEQSQKEASDLLEQNRLLQDQLRVALGREQSAREGYVLQVGLRGRHGPPGALGLQCAGPRQARNVQNRAPGLWTPVPLERAPWAMGCLGLLLVQQTEVATSPSGAWQRLHRVNQDLHGELEAQCQRQELITRQIQALKRSYGEAKDAIRHHEAEIRSLQARLGNAAAELTIKEQALAKLQGELKLEKDKVREQLEERQHSEAALSAQLRASERKLQSAEALLLGRTQELRDLQRQQALQRDRQKEVQRLQERIADLSQQLSASERAQRLMEEKLQRNYELLLGSCEREKRELLQSLKEAEDRASAFEDRLQDHEQQMEVLQKEKLSAKSEGSEAVRRLEEQLERKEASIQKLAEHVQSLRDERDLIRQRFQELMGRVTSSDGDDAHAQALERKERDLQDVLVKTAALGSSLEETEVKPQAKEESVRQFARESSEDAEEPRSSLEEAEEEDGAARSGPQLQAAGAPPGAALGEGHRDSSPRREESPVPPRSEASDREGHLQSTSKPDQGAPGLKRQRIRFSTIQCQKYTHPDGSERTWASSTSSDTSQDRSPSEESMSSEATPGSLPATSDSDTYLSIIHSLETKLYVTEEKLKDVTVKLESQQGQSQEALLALHQQWAGTEAQLREQLRASLLQVAALASQLEQERQARAEVVENHVEELGDFQVKNSEALACLESCREQLRSLPGDAGAGLLAGLESLLVGAIQALCHQPAPPGEAGFLEEEKAASRQPAHLPEPSEQEQLQLLSDQIALEATLIGQIADSLRNTSSDVSHVLLEVSQSGKWPLESESAVACPGAPVDAWAKKVLVDGEFWSQVESLSQHLETLGGEGASASGALQQHKHMLGEILGAYQTPDFERVMLQVSETLQLPAGAGDGVQVSWTGSPPEEEELALQLKDKASLLGEISATLTSLLSVEAVRDCQKLLQASRHLSRSACLGGLGQYSSLLVQDAIIQAQACYTACRIRLEYEKELRGYRESWSGSGASCQGQEQAVGALREEYEELLRKQKSEYLEVIAAIERENAELKTKVAQLDQQQRRPEEGQRERGESLAAPRGWSEEREVSCTGERPSQAEGAPQAVRGSALSRLDAVAGDRRDLERQPVGQVQTLEDEFQLKIRELQAIHEEELRALQQHYSQTLRCLQETLHHYRGRPPAAPPAHGPPSPSRPAEAGADSVMGLKERVQELEAQATCERGFAAMEETHQKKIEDLQRQHQRELEKLREEKDRLLAEETAATISAIEAMKNAHREEMERELEKSQRSQISSVNADIEALRRQYLEELQSVQRELEVLSEQYSQKCLENAHLAQALEAERQALRQCQRENQELNAHNQELNNRLAAEISRLRTLLTGDAGGEAAGSPLTQGKDAYELEVLLRVKESEIQYLKQEISSLKDELQTALRDKKYANIMKSKSNPDFLKKDRSCVSRQLRSIRSKVSLGSSPWVCRAHLGPQQRVPRVPELTGPTRLPCWASSRGFALSVSLAQQWDHLLPATAEGQAHSKQGAGESPQTGTLLGWSCPIWTAPCMSLVHADAGCLRETKLPVPLPPQRVPSAPAWPLCGKAQEARAQQARELIPRTCSSGNHSVEQDNCERLGLSVSQPRGPRVPPKTGSRG